MSKMIATVFIEFKPGVVHYLKDICGTKEYDFLNSLKKLGIDFMNNPCGLK